MSRRWWLVVVAAAIAGALVAGAVLLGRPAPRVAVEPRQAAPAAPAAEAQVAQPPLVRVPVLTVEDRPSEEAPPLARIDDKTEQGTRTMVERYHTIVEDLRLDQVQEAALRRALHDQATGWRLILAEGQAMRREYADQGQHGRRGVTDGGESVIFVDHLLPKPDTLALSRQGRRDLDEQVYRQMQPLVNPWQLKMLRAYSFPSMVSACYFGPCVE